MTLIWNQRWNNCWIYAELLLVVCACWFVADRLWVDFRCYHAPLGYDIENTWRFKLSNRTLPVVQERDSANHSEPLENLLVLMDHIRREPWVENVCLTYWSQPYCFGEARYNLYPVDSDSTALTGKVFHTLRVSPEYFSLFRIRDVKGRDVESAFRSRPQSMVLTREGEVEIFGTEQAVGRQLSFTPDLTEVYDIVSIVPTFRSNDFSRPENCVFILLEGDELKWAVDWFGIENAEISVRTKQKMDRSELFRLMESMGDRLHVNELSVLGVTNLCGQREAVLLPHKNMNKKSLTLLFFLLVNVFLGVVGTFWLRTERRREEIGLRIALGASRKRLKTEFYTEGFCLLAMTLPVVLIFILNVVVLDKLDTYREAYSVLRWAATLGITYLSTMCLIVLGIWISIYRVVRMDPAEALHYE